MIRLQQLKIKLDHEEKEIIKKILKTLKIKEQDLLNYRIVKKSIDARNKKDIKVVYSVDVEVTNEKTCLKKVANNNIMSTNEVAYNFQPCGTEKLMDRPVVVGTGPAGLFAALLLAEKGYAPIVIERGKPVEERFKDVQSFWQGGSLDPNSNVQFGEGGAGTFSDGKLNTLVKDPIGRNKKVLEVFVEAGAPPEILYINKPHIGTDYLRTVVKNIRKKIIAYGGDIRFNTTLTDFEYASGQLRAIQINGKEWIDCHVLILALGHSARDTFEMLYNKGIEMHSKPFAIGLRIEHPQSMINESQYGRSESHTHLPVAEYKLTHRCKNGRSIYSFCMCPGGYVVNAASEIGGVVTNGMSHYKRDEVNANSAVIVTVTPEDFHTTGPLAGMHYQRTLEQKAFELGGGNYQVPIQRYEDFVNNRRTTALGEVKPSLGSQGCLSNLVEILPPYVVASLTEGIQAFEQKIKGFSRPDAILSGIETRTSSPLRLVRDEAYESSIQGIYPCGEGAGYAGGITSAAMDGLKVAEAIGKRYRP